MIRKNCPMFSSNNVWSLTLCPVFSSNNKWSLWSVLSPHRQSLFVKSVLQSCLITINPRNRCVFKPHCHNTCVELLCFSCSVTSNPWTVKYSCLPWSLNCSTLVFHYDQSLKLSHTRVSLLSSLKCPILTSHCRHLLTITYSCLTVTIFEMSHTSVSLSSLHCPILMPHCNHP